MELTVVLGAVALVGALGLFWWGITARPSAARANLFAGLPQTEAVADSAGWLGKLGERTRRMLPAAMVDGLEVNLVQAGHPYGLDLPRLLGVKITLAATTFVLLLIGGLPIIGLVAGVLLYFFPDYWVLTERDKRQAAMESAIADTIDQLTICVEAGLGFDAALGRVATLNDGPLADELRRTVSDIQAGVPRAQALRMFGDRAQIAEVRQLVTALLQAQKHGVPIADTLRVQSAEMRTRRTQRTEERAAKLPVKLLFPIVFCFMPVVLIIIAAPAFIRLSDAL